jgi:enterochelin esterase-like enzyme
MSYYNLTEPEEFNYATGGRFLIPKDETQTYPVVYLIHGLGGIGDWINSSKGDILNRIENLTSNHIIKPMIFVMPQIINSNDIHRQACPYIDYNICGLINYVNEKYKNIVKDDRVHTTIAGISIGASAAIFHAVKHTDKFYNMGSISSSTVIGSMVSNDKFILKNDSGAIHYIGYSKDEGEDFKNANLNIIKNFNDHNTNIIVNQKDGSGHNFNTFNPLLEDFLSKIS